MEQARRNRSAVYLNDRGEMPPEQMKDFEAALRVAFAQSVTEWN